MSTEKRPAPVEGAPAPDPDQTTPAPEDEPDFFSQDGEHDGWSPIEKRRPSDPGDAPR